MPPKVKTSREMIIEAGYNIAAEKGIDSVNCRAIATELGCSTQPVFSRFPNMEELKEAVFSYACEKLENQISQFTPPSENSNLPKLLISSVYVITDLARNHEHLFKLIYLSDFCSRTSFLETRLSYDTNQQILSELITMYGTSREKALEVFERISLLIHGIHTVIATTSMDYKEEEILAMAETELKYVYK